MATPSEYGYDHDVKFSSDQMLAHLHQLGLQIAKPWTKPRMLPLIEKHYALQRETLGANDKEYLAHTFDPATLTKAKLRQILSQYDIPYPAGPKADKTTLVRLFRSNKARLRLLNAGNLPIPPLDPARAPSTASHLAPSTSSRAASARASSHASSSRASSSRVTSLLKSSPAPLANVLSPEQLISRIEVTFVKAVKAAERGDHWKTVRVLERILEKCKATAEKEELKMIQEEADNDSSEDEDNSEDESVQALRDTLVDLQH